MYLPEKKYTLREWQKTVKPKDELIVQASSMDKDDGWRSWPIGMCWQYVFNYQKGDSLQIGDHQTSVLCAVRTTTDQARRSKGINRKLVVENLGKNGIPNVNIHHDSYFSILPSFKFIISPEGNGIDCHRHYEALLAGCIPIMEKNPLTEEKYKGCPILWTTDYSEITLEYLEEQYAKMIDTVYDFSCLFLSSHNTEIQNLIKQSGNFWLQRLPSNCVWYKD